MRSKKPIRTWNEDAEVSGARGQRLGVVKCYECRVPNLKAK